MSTAFAPQAAKQRGAALAVALVMLVVLTLLGIAAVRATQQELRLAQNAEGRVSAQQSAESMIGLVLDNDAYLPLNDDDGFTACFVGGDNPPLAPFACASSDTEISLTSALESLQDDGYLRVQRQAPLFVEVNVLRDAQNSQRGYDFARYAITGGFDRSSDGFSAAEITESRLILHARVAGVNYE